MTKKTTYAHLNMILVDMQQQMQSPYWLLSNEGRMNTINTQNKSHIEKMHNGMREIASKYCKMEDGRPAIVDGKMTYEKPEDETDFVKELGEFMQTGFELIY